MSTSVSSFGSLRQLPAAAPPPSRIDARGWRCAPSSRDPTARSMRLRVAGSRGASSRASCRKVLVRGCVERGRANPVCQRAPESHLDDPRTGLPGLREQLASRRAARFGRPGEAPCRRLLPAWCLHERLLTIRGPGRGCALRRSPVAEPRVRFARSARERLRAPRSSERLGPTDCALSRATPPVVC